MKVYSVCGSLRERSTTSFALDRALASANAAGASVVALSLRDFELPFCDGRADPTTYGGDAQRLRERLLEADALIIGSPEYHGSFTGALKNAFDLLGPGDLMRGKVIGLLATASEDAGSMNTLSHLRHVFRWTQAWVLPQQVSIPRAEQAFDADGRVIRDGLEGELTSLGRELVRYAGLLFGDNG
ncbi:MAG: NAD(P)H-dependent oxidoreductase [Myxococcota bacterium]